MGVSIGEDARDTVMGQTATVPVLWKNNNKPYTQDDISVARVGMEGNIMNKGVGPAPGLEMSCKLSE